MGRPRRSDDQRREQRLALVNSATRLLTQPAPTRLPTVRALAEAAGISAAGVYSHYGDLNELFLDVIEALHRDLDAAIAERRDAASTPATRVIAAAKAHVEWGIAHPGAYQLLFEDTDRDEALALGRRPGAAKIRDLAVELAWAKGRRMPDVAGAVDLSAYLHGVVSLRIHKTSVRWPMSAGRQVERFVTGMLGVR